MGLAATLSSPCRMPANHLKKKHLQNWVINLITITPNCKLMFQIHFEINQAK